MNKLTNETQLFPAAMLMVKGAFKQLLKTGVAGT